MKNIKNGDYVLATKYSDGDPGDHFCVGFFDKQYKDRYMVVDSSGLPFRANGFRRIKKISIKKGDIIIRNIHLIESGNKSVWYWERNTKALAQWEKEKGEE